MKQEAKQLIEIIGIVAVVASLIFVGYEMRQNQIGLLSQTRATLAQIDIESIRSQREDEELLESLAANNPNLTAEELRMRLWWREMARTAENHFYQHRIGLFDDSEFEGILNLWRLNFGSDAVKSWWNNNKHQFSSEFQEEFENLVINLQ